jgi:excisionase family DNA binding protein
LEKHLPDWKLCYRIDEAVVATGIGRTKLYQLIKEGKLQARRAEGTTVILRDELQRYLHGLPTISL